jgi:hypothetical protein
MNIVHVIAEKVAAANKLKEEYKAAATEAIKKYWTYSYGRERIEFIVTLPAEVLMRANEDPELTADVMKWINSPEGTAWKEEHGRR